DCVEQARAQGMMQPLEPVHIPYRFFRHRFRPFPSLLSENYSRTARGCPSEQPAERDPFSRCPGLFSGVKIPGTQDALHRKNLYAEGFDSAFGRWYITLLKLEPDKDRLRMDPDRGKEREMSLQAELLGGVAGAAAGLLIGWINMRITRRSMGRDSMSAVMGTNMIRMLINFALLLLIFLVRNVSPFGFTGTLLGAAAGLSVGNVLFIMKLRRDLSRDSQEKAEVSEQ
ncbi:MAG: hypothetical protein IJH79_05885, partial [Lentisphaeria bacterium]|nr:hypothetical protein [Lentisphaeria bacterium]